MLVAAVATKRLDQCYQNFDFSDEILVEFVMGKIALTVSKWQQFSILKG